MKKITIINILFILISQINGEKSELIAGHVLFRYGDRTPLSTYPTDPMQEKDWPNGFGQLTIAGIQQTYRLGKYLRSRYGSLLNDKYIHNEIYVRSTDFNRTLMSAQSSLVGLYPLSEDFPPKIPIRTVPRNQDYLLGVNNCPRSTQTEQNIHKSEEIKKLNIYYKPFSEKLQTWTNISKITLFDIWDLKIAETILIENIYKKAPSWATKDVQRNLTNITNTIFKYLYANEDNKRIRGGPLVEEIWKNMANATRGEAHFKLTMYSAHDITISPVLSFLGINYPHQPPVASALFFDLYKQNSQYFVKVEYLNVTGSNRAYSQVLANCTGTVCSFDNFTSIYQPHFPSNVNIECTKKSAGLSMDDRHKKNIIVLITSLIIVGIFFIIVIVFICLFSRRIDYSPPLLSS